MAWLSKELLDSAPAHVKQGHRAALNYRMHGKSIDEVRGLVSYFKDVQLGVLRPASQIERRDLLEFGSGLDGLGAQFRYHKATGPLVQVWPVIKGVPSPRLRLSLGGVNIKATRDRLNSYAREFGVKFYCYQHRGVTWAIWVLDGTSMFAPLGDTDRVFCTP